MSDRDPVGYGAVLSHRAAGPDYNTAQVREIQTPSYLCRNRQLDMREKFQADAERYGERREHPAGAREPFEQPSAQAVAE
jgi:hypothetical protein